MSTPFEKGPGDLWIPEDAPDAPELTDEQADLASQWAGAPEEGDLSETCIGWEPAEDLFSSRLSELLDTLVSLTPSELADARVQKRVKQLATSVTEAAGKR